MGTCFMTYFESKMVSVMKKRDGTRESWISDSWTSDSAIQSTPKNVATRLVDRDSSFHQSEGDWYIKRKVPGDQVLGLFFGGDPVLALVYMKTPRCCLVLMVIFLTCTVVMAIPWAIMGDFANFTDRCNITTTSFLRAYTFSLEIMMTIGFGAKDIYFGGCVTPSIVLTIHSCMSLMLQAGVLGVLYQRISRTRSRRKTIVMSNRAIIRRIRGKLYFMFQVCELRKMQLVEAKVRVYAVRYERMGSAGAVTCQTYNMRLSHPNDDLGSRILLSLPQVIVHDIDDFSPLLPPKCWKEPPTVPLYTPRPYSPPDIDTHKDTCSGGDRDSYLSSTPAEKMWEIPSALHSQADNKQFSESAPSQSISRRRSQYSFPEVITRQSGRGALHPDGSEDTLKPCVDPEQQREQYKWEQQDVKAFMQDRRMEIVVVVEGMDPQTSHNVQAFHSYRYDEIVWDHFFVPCTSIDSNVPMDTEDAKDAPSHN